jgi:hypothetical protein
MGFRKENLKSWKRRFGKKANIVDIFPAFP